MDKIPASEITPERVYLSRRQFMLAASAAATGALLAACGVNTPAAAPTSAPVPAQPPSAGAPAAVPTAMAGASGAVPAPGQASKTTDELGDKLNTYEQITNYNNYYEFSLDKEGIGDLAKGFKTAPWSVAVGGLVNKPKTYDIQELLNFQQEERIYRLRCVEAWSLVVPWIGFPLSRLLQAVEPKPEAKYVRFQTALVPDQMPGTKSGWFQWPYVEGLRLDEAMHNLTLLATGLYGKPLPAQDGAPLRLVVPWKYGFKSCKSIVKIDLVADMPKTFWMEAGPDEYGFYANVNPDVPHPRWSQATERRIGELTRRKTLPFNGYGDQVAQMYQGMDLKKFF